MPLLEFKKLPQTNQEASRLKNLLQHEHKEPPQKTLPDKSINFYNLQNLLIMNPDYSQDELDNHANQLNDNNDAYWQSRDYDERPSDWDRR